MLFGITRRAFNRLLTSQSVTNWNNCKPLTKERLLRLKQFLDDKSQIQLVLDKIRNEPQNAVQANGSDDGEMDDTVASRTLQIDESMNLDVS